MNAVQGKDYVGFAVGAMIFDSNNRVLMLKRSVGARDNHGKWDLVGGAVGQGEDLIEALKREIREEVGVEVSVGESLGYIEVIDSEKHWVGLGFKCLVVHENLEKFMETLFPNAKTTVFAFSDAANRSMSGEAKILEPEKFSDLRWVEVSEIYGMDLAEPARLHLENYKKKSRLSKDS